MKIFKVFAFILVLILTIIAAALIKNTLEKRMYKLEYTDEIKKYSKEFSLDPYFVAAIIHVESGNKPKATSQVGAMGLMQIMPETGKWIAGKLKQDFDKQDLFDPETNIKFGCWYINFLEKRFDNKNAVSAAYNAGHNAVAKWMTNPELSSDQQSLDEIPYSQTKQYVEKVAKTYEKYKELYPKALELY